MCGEISRPAADSAACRPVEAAPSHPEAAADPSGCLAGAYHLAAAASAHSSGTSSAVEAASFLLAADRPAAECLETADYHPAAGRLWEESPAEDCPEGAVPEAAVSVRSSEASSVVVAVSSHLAAGQPGVEYPEAAGCCPAEALQWADCLAVAASVHSSAASSAAFGRPAIASRAAAASAG